MNVNGHNESNKSEKSAVTSFGKLLGNSTWHISRFLLITQRVTGTFELLRQRYVPSRQTREREIKIKTARIRV